VRGGNDSVLSTENEKSTRWQKVEEGWTGGGRGCLGLCQKKDLGEHLGAKEVNPRKVVSAVEELRGGGGGVRICWKGAWVAGDHRLQIGKPPQDQGELERNQEGNQLQDPFTRCLGPKLGGVSPKEVEGVSKRTGPR